MGGLLCGVLIVVRVFGFLGWIGISVYIVNNTFVSSLRIQRLDLLILLSSHGWW